MTLPLAQAGQERSPLSKLPGWACLCGAQEDAAVKPVKCWACGGEMYMWRVRSDGETHPSTETLPR